MDTFLAILVAVTVYVLGQIIVKMVVEPVHQMKKTMAAIAHAFLRDADKVGNADGLAPEQKNELRARLRELSGLLLADASLVPFYRYTRYVFGLPAMDRVHAATIDLIAIGNWLSAQSISRSAQLAKRTDTLHDNLGLYRDAVDRYPD